MYRNRTTMGVAAMTTWMEGCQGKKGCAADHPRSDAIEYGKISN